MPDGDRVHPGLSRPYQKSYKQLCEGQFSSASLAEEVIGVLKGQLQKIGDEPAHLVDRVAAELSQIPDEPLLRRACDWPSMSSVIDRTIAQAGLPKRISEYIADAGRTLLYDLRQGDAFGNINVQLMERMLKRMYGAEFKERVPMTQHYNGVNQQFVDARLAEMQQHVDRQLAHIAQQAARRTTFQRLRKVSDTKPKIDLHDTDLLSLE